MNNTDNDIVKNIYNALTHAESNVIFVTQSGGQLIYTDENTTTANDLRFFDCDNLMICVNHRVNHILLYNCSNVTIIVSKGLITGKIDIVKCHHSTVILRSNCRAITDESGNGFVAYYVDLSNSHNIKLYVEKIECLKVFQIMAINTIQNQVISFGFANPDLQQFALTNIYIKKRNYLDYNYFNNNYVYVLNDDDVLECFDDKWKNVKSFNRNM